MFLRKQTISSILRQCNTKQLQQARNIQVAIIGAANAVGSKVALKMKHNPKITKLKLYDFEEQVTSVAKDLNQIPGGPTVVGFTGDDLKSAITMTHLILMVYDSYPTDAMKKEIAICNAPAVRVVCQAMADRNPDAILAISTSPINAMVPFACSMLHKYKAFNPFKVFGIANHDVVRAKSFAARLLGANPRHLTVPVIGGCSEDTVVPLFSNLQPKFYFLDSFKAEKLIRQVRKCDIYRNERGTVPKSLVSAWSISDCSEKVIDALRGAQVEVHCYSANPGFGTRFFTAPVTFGPKGITRTGHNFSMSPLECSTLSESIPYINSDIGIGESLAAQYN